MLFIKQYFLQDKAREEILHVLEEDKENITYDKIQKMEYLERCLKETMRLFSSVPLIARRLSENLVISKY